MKTTSICTVLVLLIVRPTSADAAEAPGASTPGFRFGDVSNTSLGLWEGSKRVLVYNHAIISKAGVPTNWNRSTYVHPIYGLDGEVLTDDFPKDHYHHRGLFWAWPHVKIGGKEYDLWALQGIEQRFERWLAREATITNAVLGVQNGWYVGQRSVMRETVWLRTYPATVDGRYIDVDLTWTVGDEPIMLRGAPDKSYGGLTLRFAPRTNTVITTPLGKTPEDLPVTHLEWADLSARFEGRQEASGAAIFIGRDHPDYPPEWLTRHYGVLCVGWPGVNGKTFAAREMVHCRYRVWIHRGAVNGDTLKEKYGAYQ